MKNIDKKVVSDFGKEWLLYNHKNIDKHDLKETFYQYFNIFPFYEINKKSEGFDMGSGSGRWAKFIVNKVGLLNCVEPSKEAIDVSKKNLANFNNVKFHNYSVSDDILDEKSQDFGYCLGVLHHIPDTFDGIKSCARILKPNAPFLLYLYYNFENKPLSFRVIWKISNLLRILIAYMPHKTKVNITKIIAVLIYLPLARFALVMSKIGFNSTNIPLSYYKDKSLYIMQNDSLDRFGTTLEKRFSKLEIEKMLIDAGFKNIVFSNQEPFWVCLARKI